ncbi:phosphotransferase [Nocardia brasiliensis]|uniref:Phosphotransferase n=1 Tax=Nocardia brasiliensis TaxID=37326 RepID=A0A6G9Y2L6_NOCBR|nr:aminoglycoside phosphotransferase family protein [Nocardia brasiliensis]QIS07370.1 phosphotransferase [Nocardia brasiliensis]
MHVDQLDVSLAVVRGLVDEQFPEWRGLAVRAVAGAGTDNALFRIGDRLAARFPLRAGAVESVRESLRREAAAARELLGRTRVPTPEPVAIGEPGAGYPLPWAVQTWLDGTAATVADPGSSVEFACDLADFIRDVRSIDTRGRTFSGRGRGGELHTHDAWMQICFERSADLLDVPALRRLWADMRELPRGTTPDVMSHCDLIPGNVLVAAGRLVGVIDVGGLGPADPALDLVSAWHLLEPTARNALRTRLAPDDLEWSRARAWAFQQAMGLVWYYLHTNPPMSYLGRRTLTRILTDPPTE